MTQYLPPNLLALFAPREPIPYLEPLDQLPWEKKPWHYTGISKYLSLFEVGVKPSDLKKLDYIVPTFVNSSVQY